MVVEMLQSGIIEQVKEESSDLVINPVNIIKCNDKFRFLIHFKLNYMYQYKDLKLSSIVKFADDLIGVEDVVKFDLKWAFFQIPIVEQDRNLLGFTFDNCKFKFKVLPFGVAFGTLICHELIRLLVNHISSSNGNLFGVNYVDDIVYHNKMCGNQKIEDKFSDLANQIGLVLNMDKMHKGRTFEFTGLIIDLEHQVIRLRLKTREQVKNLALKFLNHGATYSEMESFRGILEFCLRIAPDARVK